jgi:protein tyrosine phosphatase (PTP) superfamily phosphohydrolase (DUF442 family)
MVRRLGGGMIVLSMVLVGVAGCCSFRARSMYPPWTRPPFGPRCPNCGPVVPGRPMPAPPLAAPPAQPFAAASPVPPWQPHPGPSIRLQAPEPAIDSQPAPPSSPRLYAPEQEPQPSEPSPPPPPQNPNPMPDRPLLSPLPIGIPGFAEVQKGISNGLRPNSLDGLDWLAASGYRTVLHLREPGQDDTSDRKQFESRGLRYLSLEVSPDTLSPEVVDRFNRVISDLGGQPLFVYDRDGMLAGGLWYLHFRLVDNLPDDEALARAGRLGLKTNPTGGHQRMLLAVQKYLSEHPR